MAMHTCAPDKKHRLAFITLGVTSPLSKIRVACAPWKLSNVEKLAAQIAVDTTAPTEKLRNKVWNELLDDDSIGKLILSIRSYREAVLHLGIAKDSESWTPYQYSAFEDEPNARSIEALVNAVTDTFGKTAGEKQAYALSLKGRTEWEESGRKKPATPPPPMPKLPPLTLPAKSKPTAKEITDRTVVMVVNFRGIGNRRKVSTNEIEVVGEEQTEEKEKADKNWLAVSKKLIDAPELEAIASLDGEARRYIEGRTVGSRIKRGVYVVSKDSVKEMDAKLTEFAERRGVLVKLLCAAYERLTSEAKVRLKKLFDRNDYLTVDELRAAFALEWSYVAVNTPKSLEEIDEMIWKKEQEKMAKSWLKTAEQAEQLLFAGMMETVTGMIEKLSPSPEGKKRIIRDGYTDKINEFLASVNPRNIGNNNQLRAVNERLQQLMSGVDASVLSESEKARDYIKSGFEQVQKVLGTLVVDKPKRRIQVDD